MKKIFPILFASCVGLATTGCNDAGTSGAGQEPAQVAADTTATSGSSSPEEAEPMPYPAKVSDWKTGDPELIRKVLSMYKNYETGSSNNEALQLLADSIEFISFDDRTKKYAAADFLKHVKGLRAQFKAVNLEFQSYVCLHSEAYKVDMVTLWIRETVTWKDGQKESTSYLETWLFNEQGKIFRAGDYSRYRR